jgi:hypothetical protein
VFSAVAAELALLISLLVIVEVWLLLFIRYQWCGGGGGGGGADERNFQVHTSAS